MRFRWYEERDEENVGKVTELYLPNGEYHGFQELDRADFSLMLPYVDQVAERYVNGKFVGMTRISKIYTPKHPERQPVAWIDTVPGRPLIIAFDFDGLLAKNEFPKIGAPNIYAFDFAQWARKRGAVLLLWTCRGGDPAGTDIAKVVAMCSEHGLEFDGINQNWEGMPWRETRKIYAHVYLDDKNWPRFGLAHRADPCDPIFAPGYWNLLREDLALRYSSHGRLIVTD